MNARAKTDLSKLLNKPLEAWESALGKPKSVVEVGKCMDGVTASTERTFIRPEGFEIVISHTPDRMSGQPIGADVHRVVIWFKAGTVPDCSSAFRAVGFDAKKFKTKGTPEAAHIDGFFDGACPPIVDKAAWTGDWELAPKRRNGFSSLTLTWVAGETVRLKDN